MNDSNLSAADIMALTKGDDQTMWMNNPFIYFVWMMFMRWFNNGENGGNALTQAELFDGLGRQDILGNQRSILDAICGLNGNMNSGFGDVRYDNLRNLTDLQGRISDCCCKTQSGIADLKAEGFKNTCEITTAIHQEGEITRGMINDQIIQGLRDKLADKDRDLLFANFRNSQTEQTAGIVDALRPVSRPAYITCSPYQTNTGCPYST